MTDQIDRAAAIAELKVLRRTHNGSRSRMAAIDLALSALEADDGRAMRWVGSPAHVQLWDAINEVVSASGGNASSTGVARQKAVAKVEAALCKIIAVPATEPAEAAPAADDEARIAECMHRVGQAMLSLRHDWMLRVYDSDFPEDQKRKAAVDAIDDVFVLMRSLAAGKAKAEAEANTLRNALAKRGHGCDAEGRCVRCGCRVLVEKDSDGIWSTDMAREITDLRSKLATAEAEVARLSGRTNFCAECEVLADRLAEAEEGEAEGRREIELLHTRLNHRGKEIDRLGVELAEAEKQRDAAIAAQNEVAVRELEAVVKSCMDAAERWRRTAETAGDQHERDRLMSRVDQLEGIAHHTKTRVDELRAEQPKTDAKPDAGDDADTEVLRYLLIESLPVQLCDVIRCLRILIRRALGEVRP